jgi:hypothetical protein
VLSHQTLEAWSLELMGNSNCCQARAAAMIDKANLGHRQSAAFIIDVNSNKRLYSSLVRLVGGITMMV